MPRVQFAGFLLPATLALVGFADRSIAQTNSNQPDPDAVFKKAGLQRSGNSLVLDSELEANKLEGSLEKLQGKIQQQQLQQQQAQEMFSQAQQLRNEANASRNQGRRPRGARNAGNQQYNNLMNQAQQLEQQARNRFGPNQTNALNRDLQQFDNDQSRYRGLVNTTLKEYRDLAKQEDLIQAMRRINHNARPKVALGPIPQYVPNLARQCSDTLIDLGLNRTKDIFHPANDDKVAAEIAAAALQHHKAEKAKEAEPNLRDDVARLRAAAEEATAEREKFADDPEVKDLLEEVQRGQRAKVRVGSSPKLIRALNDLESIEKDLGIEPKSP